MHARIVLPAIGPFLAIAGLLLVLGVALGAGFRAAVTVLPVGGTLVFAGGAVHVLYRRLREDGRLVGIGYWPKGP